MQLKPRKDKSPRGKTEPGGVCIAVQVKTQSAIQSGLCTRSFEKLIDFPTKVFKIRAGVSRNYTGHSTHGHLVIGMTASPIHVIQTLLRVQPSKRVDGRERDLNANQPAVRRVCISQMMLQRRSESLSKLWPEI